MFSTLAESKFLYRIARRASVKRYVFSRNVHSLSQLVDDLRKDHKDLDSLWSKNFQELPRTLDQLENLLKGFIGKLDTLYTKREDTEKPSNLQRKHDMDYKKAKVYISSMERLCKDFYKGYVRLSDAYKESRKFHLKIRSSIMSYKNSEEDISRYLKLLSKYETHWGKKATELTKLALKFKELRQQMKVFQHSSGLGYTRPLNNLG